MDAALINQCKIIGLTDKSTECRTSEFKQKKLKFDRISMSLNEINKFIEKDIGSDLLKDVNISNMMIKTFWVQCHKIAHFYGKTSRKKSYHHSSKESR